MLKIFQDTHYHFQDQIRALYLKTFSKGEHAQEIDQEELDNEIRLTYQEGMMMVAVEDSVLSGALFVYPLQFDVSSSTVLPDYIDSQHSPYIAQLMVDEIERGKGMGHNLLQHALTKLQQNHFTEVFIRVWIKNLHALQLYHKAGFKEVGKIYQKKFFINKQMEIVMEKVYLRKMLFSADDL